MCIADRDEDGIKTAISELGEHSESVLSVKVDVADWDSQVQGFDKAVTEFGRIDYVFPIAGVGDRRWLKKDQTEKWQKPDLTCIDVNLNGPLYTIALAVQQMRRQEPNDFGFRGKSKSLGIREFFSSTNATLLQSLQWPASAASTLSLQWQSIQPQNSKLF